MFGAADTSRTVHALKYKYMLAYRVSDNWSRSNRDNMERVEEEKRDINVSRFRTVKARKKLHNCELQNRFLSRNNVAIRTSSVKRHARNVGSPSSIVDLSSFERGNWGNVSFLFFRSTYLFSSPGTTSQSCVGAKTRATILEYRFAILRDVIRHARAPPVARDDFFQLERRRWFWQVGSRSTL
jgi:hypothetical protein